MIMDFISAIKKGVEYFKGTEGPVRIISHLDCDGLSSAAILTRAMYNEDRPFNLSIVRSLTEDVIKEVASENYKTVIFSDLGSGGLKSINDLLKGKEVFILDHHLFADVELNDNIHFINPLVYKKDDYGAGVQETAFEIADIEDIINERYHLRYHDDGKITVMATNQDIKTLPDRIVRRFRDPEFGELVLNEAEDFGRRK